jgi:hypothetical protein
MGISAEFLLVRDWRGADDVLEYFQITLSLLFTSKIGSKLGFVRRYINLK